MLCPPILMTLISACMQKYSSTSVLFRNSLLTNDSPISGESMCSLPVSLSSLISFDMSSPFPLAWVFPQRYKNLMCPANFYSHSPSMDERQFYLHWTDLLYSYFWTKHRTWWDKHSSRYPSLQELLESGVRDFKNWKRKLGRYPTYLFQSVVVCVRGVFASSQRDFINSVMKEQNQVIIRYFMFVALTCISAYGNRVISKKWSINPLFWPLHFTLSIKQWHLWWILDNFLNILK